MIKSLRDISPLKYFFKKLKLELPLTANKCDISKCSEMTMEECEAMCLSKGCSKEETEMCLSNYDADGNWKGSEE